MNRSKKHFNRKIPTRQSSNLKKESVCIFFKECYNWLTAILSWVLTCVFLLLNHLSFYDLHFPLQTQREMYLQPKYMLDFVHLSSIHLQMYICKTYMVIVFIQLVILPRITFYFFPSIFSLLLSSSSSFLSKVFFQQQRFFLWWRRSLLLSSQKKFVEFPSEVYNSYWEAPETQLAFSISLEYREKLAQHLYKDQETKTPILVHFLQDSSSFLVFHLPTRFNT